MNDKLIMENYLLVLKSTIEVYIHGTLESSNESVRNVLKQGLDETLKHQERTYTEIKNNGWYQVNNVKCSVINQTFTKLNNK